MLTHRLPQVIGGAQETMGKVLKKPAMQEKGAERKTSELSSFASRDVELTVVK